MLQAITYTSGSDVIAAAKAVNRRLWTAGKPVIITPARIERIWTSHMNAHVEAYTKNKNICEYVEATLESGEARHEDQETRVWISEIIVQCAKHYGVSVLDIKSNSRIVTIVRPRQVAMYLAKTLTQCSLPQVGRLFGGRDHTTILHAVRKISGLVKSGDAVANHIAVISKALRGEMENG